MRRSELCDSSYAYIVVDGTISVTGTVNANTRNNKLTFKNNALFKLYISKISNRSVDNAEDLDVIMPMYDLLEYNAKYSML